ncbi:MAG: hypothetical protein K9W42_13905 [Candidatus Heimdallarchaeota archaeon]|nr:hypothetical protein [Candidatus Heimdallarchaeota archaeon]
MKRNNLWKNNRRALLCFLILILFSITTVVDSNNSTSPPRPMRKIQIVISKIACQNFAPGATYTFTLFPEYFRLFEYYGDELTSDSNYKDWSGGSFEYPRKIGSGNNVYYDDLRCDWSLCLDFDQQAITDNNFKGEVYIKFKLHKNVFLGKNQYITKYFDTYSYDTEYILVLNFGMGIVKAYLTFQLLS